jgi:hypothetical protein
MFGSQILDVGIGLFLIYLLMSIVCSAIREGVEGYLKTRAKFLERGIQELLNGVSGGNLAADIYNHPLVYGLFPGAYKPRSSTAGQPAENAENAENGGTSAGGYWFSTNLPSYIPASNFAAALLDRVARGPVGSDSTDTRKPEIASVRQKIAALDNPQVTRVLLAALDAADDDLAAAQKNIEAWYNSAMDRVSGWYKRRTQLVLLVLGLVVTVLANVDSLAVARHLYHDQAARQALVGRAQALDRESPPKGVTLQSVTGELEKIQLPIGWSDPRVFKGSGITRLPSPSDLLKAEQRSGLWNVARRSLLGWLITALAISLGAPFWFDVLNRVMVIRSTVKPHEKSLEEASEDRQKTKK